MPLYEFHCDECDHTFEELFKSGHNTRKILAMECPKCKGLAQKIISKYSFKVNGHNAANGYSKKGSKK